MTALGSARLRVAWWQTYERFYQPLSQQVARRLDDQMYDQVVFEVAFESLLDCEGRQPLGPPIQVNSRPNRPYHPVTDIVQFWAAYSDRQGAGFFRLYQSMRAYVRP